MGTRKIREHRKRMVEKIIDKMASGNLKWLRPWKYPELRLPFNPITGTRYSGVNVAYLLTEAEDNGFRDPRWMTFLQAKEKGLRIKRGAHGSRIEFWSKFQPKENGVDGTSLKMTGEEVDQGDMDNLDDRDVPDVPFCMIYTVFNGSQIEGLSEWASEENQATENFQKNARCERIMRGCGVDVRFGHRHASYSFNAANPSEEMIRMPNRELFKDESHFYATLLHELAHSTGNPLRMDRDIRHPYGSKKYALEELRAEFASAFVLMDIMLPLDDEGMEDHIDQHAAYIQHWRKIADDAPEEFTRAIRTARQIADTVLSYEGLDFEKAS